MLLLPFPFGKFIAVEIEPFMDAIKHEMGTVMHRREGIATVSRLEPGSAWQAFHEPQPWSFIDNRNLERLGRFPKFLVHVRTVH